MLQELLRRGHDVHLLFERDDHEPSEDVWLAEMEQREGFTWSLTQTLKYDTWRHYAMRIRSATDAIRFFSPPFRDSGYLFIRAEHRAPRWFRRLAARPSMQSQRARNAITRVLDTVEASIPSSRRLEQELASHEPDVFVMCPHLMPGMRHSDYLKATRALGLRSILAVASWDNLSSKQQLHELADRVTVWNETQSRGGRDAAPASRASASSRPARSASTSGSAGSPGRATSSARASASTRRSRTSSMSAGRCFRRR